YSQGYPVQANYTRYAQIPQLASDPIIELSLSIPLLDSRQFCIYIQLVVRASSTFTCHLYHPLFWTEIMQVQIKRICHQHLPLPHGMQKGHTKRRRRRGMANPTPT